MKAILKNYRQSPRKVRLVANLIKGKSVGEVETELSFLVKRAALPFQKLLDSAVANAKHNFKLDKEDLYVKDVRVDKGIVMKRMMPRARGSASRINKRTSHLILVLDEKANKSNKKEVIKKGALKKEVKDTKEKVVPKVKAPAKTKTIKKTTKK